MGLLDQVLGQVIGNMAGGAQGGRASAPDGGLGDLLGQVLRGGLGGTGGTSASAPGSQQAPGGGGLGDLLGQVLRGGQGAAPTQAPQQAPGGGLGDLLGSAGGKMSPLLLAVLAILAAKHIPTGAGGLGSILHDMLGGGARGRESGPEDDAAPEGYAGDEGHGEPPAGMGAPRYPEARGGSGRGGGFLDDVGSMLDGPGGRTAQSSAGNPLGGDFDELRHHFEQNGHGSLIDSWIGSGPNREAAPDDLEQALGPQTIDRLSQQFGIERGQLLDELTRALPQVVDGLTPQGRAPTRDEQSRWI